VLKLMRKIKNSAIKKPQQMIFLAIGAFTFLYSRKVSVPLN
jgi:hypothetical protein